MSGCSMKLLRALSQCATDNTLVTGNIYFDNSLIWWKTKITKLSLNLFIENRKQLDQISEANNFTKSSQLSC